MAPRPLGSRDHRITLAAAADMTRRYRDAKVPQYNIRAGAFDAAQVRDLLAQKDCTALRIYLGLDDANSLSLILVGVNAAGADLTAGTIMEMNWPCPPMCDDTSPLESRCPLR